MRITVKLAAAVAFALTLAQPAAAQRRVELGLDAGIVFGLGAQSSVSLNVPGSRFRVGFLTPGSPIALEPALGFSYNKVEGTDGILTYDLQVGAVYHFGPVTIDNTATEGGAVRLPPAYVRPFVGVTGFTGGDTSDSEISLGAGVGLKVPWRRDLALRYEANIGYGFDNKAARLGALIGLSYFPR
jgi:hypothetical protein